jgi:hypothetical protein
MQLGEATRFVAMIVLAGTKGVEHPISVSTLLRITAQRRFARFVALAPSQRCSGPCLCTDVTGNIGRTERQPYFEKR